MASAVDLWPIVPNPEHASVLIDAEYPTGPGKDRKSIIFRTPARRLPGAGVCEGSIQRTVRIESQTHAGAPLLLIGLR